jgi:hypothetical protein
LLEQELEQKKTLEVKEEEAEDALVCVLADDADKNSMDDEVPCRPDLSLIRADDHNGTQEIASPGRESSPHKKGDFISEILSSLPQIRLLRREFERVRDQQAATASSVVSEQSSLQSLPPRIKGKRIKSANIETLLKASVKPDLRRRMERIQGVWARGAGSSLQKDSMAVRELTVDTKALSTRVPSVLFQEPQMRAPLNRPDSIGGDDGDTDGKRLSVASRASDEEKELAMELLLLSPGRACTPLLEASKLPEIPCFAMNKEIPLLSFCLNVPDDRDSLVTPSDSSPTGQGRIDNDMIIPRILTCGACRGRMRMHSCGKREKPVDYEAIERAEREQKEREEDEKVRQRTEKRRAADVKRRETRKKKKEQEVARRLQEELVKQEGARLQVGQFESAQMREQDEEPTPPHGFQSLFPTKSYIPSFAAIKSSSQDHSTLQYTDDYYEDTENSQYNGFSSSSQGWASHQQEPLRHPPESHSSSVRQETLLIDGTEVQPSTSIPASDALAALAGLADRMPAATNNITISTSVREAFPPAPASWYSNQEDQDFHAQYPTDTHCRSAGSASGSNYDRRTAMAEAFLGSFNMQAFSSGNGKIYSYNVPAAPPVLHSDSQEQEGYSSSSWHGSKMTQQAEDCYPVLHGFNSTYATTTNTGGDSQQLSTEVINGDEGGIASRPSS